jgi:hypothetical protein
MGEVNNLCKLLVKNYEGKTILGRHRHKWEDNIKMDLQLIVCEFVQWIHQAPNRVQCLALVNTMIKEHFGPRKTNNFLIQLGEY